MNDRTKQLLESVGKTQSRRRRQDRGKQVAVDAVLESTRGARPSDQMGSLSGVDVLGLVAFRVEHVGRGRRDDDHDKDKYS